MLKKLLIIGAATIGVPALAQATPTPETGAPPTDQPDPSSSQPTAPSPAPAPEGGMAQPAPSSTAATPAQIAQIVDREFASYDADKSNDLSQEEFAAWMKKLRTATEPSIDPESEQVKSWIVQAWGAADADASGRISKEELTAFLSRGA